MNKNQGDILEVVEIAVKFIKTLNKEELKEIINTEKKFILVNNDEIIINKILENNNKLTKQRSISKEKKYDKASVFELGQVNEFDIYIRELSRLRSKEIAINYLLENKLTVTKLKILAKKLSIYIKSKSKKIDIIQAIVEGIVGSRLKLESLREY